MYQNAIGAQHMRTTEDRVPGAARSVPRGAAVLREGVSRISARGGLLHQQSRQDRLPVRRAVHDLGRSRRRPRTGATGRDKSQPFFSVFNLEVTHESQIFPSSPARKGKPLVTDPAKITVPPYYPDTPLVREELARMYDNIADMDARSARSSAARGRRTGREHDRLLLERSRRRRARARSDRSTIRACACRS